VLVGGCVDGISDGDGDDELAHVLARTDNVLRCLSAALTCDDDGDDSAQGAAAWALLDIVYANNGE